LDDPIAARRPYATRKRGFVRLGVPAGLLLLAALTVTLAACAPSVPEVQRLGRYEALLQAPLPARVVPADEAVLERAHQTNLKYGDDVRPRAADPGHPLAPVVKRVLAELPGPVERLAERHLAAVYLLEGDVGTATSEGVRGPDGRWSHAYIALNLSALQRDANAWATWKERSAFRPGPGYALRMTLEPEATDDRAGAVRFILLHELGHVLGLGLGVHGYWDDPEPIPAATRRSPFVALSWEPRPAQGQEPPRMASRYAERFPLLSGVDFYRFDKAPTALEQAPQVYAELEQTDFPSLYGTLQPFDDFAEAFAITVHALLLHKPYRVEVLHDGQVVRTYRSCIVTRACAAKIAQVQALLAAAPSGVRVHVDVGAGFGIKR
jgi:hypothetical protein